MLKHCLSGCREPRQPPGPAPAAEENKRPHKPTSMVRKPSLFPPFNPPSRQPSTTQHPTLLQSNESHQLAQNTHTFCAFGSRGWGTCGCITLTSIALVRARIILFRNPGDYSLHALWSPS
eukprot:4552218-Amphidinium_carterae.1